MPQQIAVVHAGAAAELAHCVSELGSDERVDHDRGASSRLLHGDVQILDVLGARMPYLDEGLVGELSLEREHESLSRLPGRVRDDVKLDGLAARFVRAHPAEATAAC